MKAQSAQLKAGFGLSGRFCITATNAETGETRVVAPWQDNLILDNGLDNFHYRGTINKCFLGTSNSTPVVSQTTLDAQTGSGQTVNNDSGGQSTNTSSPYEMEQAATYRFAQGAVTGNIAEVGVGPSSNDLFSRALIKDASGSPTTISLVAKDQLDVYYTLRVYPNLNDTTSSIVVDGVSRTITCRPGLLGNSNKWKLYAAYGINDLGDVKFLSPRSKSNEGIHEDPTLAPVTSYNNTAPEDVYTVSRDAYLAGDHKIKGTVTIDTSRGNFANGIGHIAFSSTNGMRSFWQAKIDPAIVKDNTQKLTLGVEISWGRQ